MMVVIMPVTDRWVKKQATTSYDDDDDYDEGNNDDYDEIEDDGGGDGDQGCISCGILVSGIGARGVSSEHMENMEMFSCSPT